MIVKMLNAVVDCLWVALSTTVSRSRERLKKLPWVSPETLFTNANANMDMKDTLEIEK